MNFSMVLSELAAVLELPQPPPAADGQVVFEIENLGQLRVAGVDERVVLVLSRPRLHQNMPPRERLLTATHFTSAPSLMMPLELKDDSVIGLATSLDQREATAPALRLALEGLTEALDQIFQTR